MKEIVLSGIRPTGNLHLGNYYGAVQNFVKMQEDYNRSVEESNARWNSNNVKIDYCSVADWYDRAPRGTYFGD